jgi:aspartyl-tRNA synthetase
LVDPKNTALGHAIDQLKPETVLEATGTVLARDAAAINPNMKTGTVEIKVAALKVLNVPLPLPFQIDDSADKVNEELRLKYRYLDLRRPKNFETMRLRHKAVKVVRDFMDAQGFLEIETPMLFKSTPEGAREFLVPSRLNQGQFYALPQSPQQYKQMLMVAGMERYFQIARCFRDEDLRADRQPEFSQIDIEMSFIEREDIYKLIEGMLKSIWKQTLNVDIQTPFLRMPYHEAMNRFGVDKPDMRFGFELVDLNDVFAQSSFKVFKGTIEKGGVVKAINLKGLADVTTGETKALEDAAKAFGAPGLAFIKAEGGQWKSPIVKFFSAEEQAALKSKLNIEEGDLVLFAAADWDKACTILGRLRLDGAQMLAKRGKITINPREYKFLWVVDFPLMVFDEEKGGYFSAHHPFTAPVEEDAHLLDSEPKKVRGQHYDIVLNGTELGGGSIRIHSPELQKKVFEDVLQIPKDIVETRFGYMVEAFRYGAPPHGGIALGLDRLITILAAKSSIRDVIAFPKTQKGQEMMTQSPGAVSEKQLKELRIMVVGEQKQSS